MVMLAYDVDRFPEANPVKSESRAAEETEETVWNSDNVRLAAITAIGTESSPLVREEGKLIDQMSRAQLNSRDEFVLQQYEFERRTTGPAVDLTGYDASVWQLPDGLDHIDVRSSPPVHAD